MKTVALSSVLVLFAIISVISVNPAFAQATEITIETAQTFGTQDCADTAEGCFVPSTATVAVGGTVTMSNTDNVVHTFISGNPVDGPTGIFDSELLQPGDSFVWLPEPETAGEHEYFCMVHPWMTGIIMVQQAGSDGDDTMVMNENDMDGDAMMDENTLGDDPAMMEDPAMDEDAMMDDGAMDGAMMDDGAMDDKEMTETASDEGGGCLVATAAFGTELAPQVQFLREIRDNTVMSTDSGMAFMTGFNQFYYSFSPAIADMERENPMFQQAVRAFITPMISTLSILSLAEQGNDFEVFGLGVSVIGLNLAMYIAAPAFVGFAISKRLRK